MSHRVKIMVVAFIGLHVPLVLMMAAAAVLDLAQAKLIIGLVFAATLVAVAMTLTLLWGLLAQTPAHPKAQTVMRG